MWDRSPIAGDDEKPCRHSRPLTATLMPHILLILDKRLENILLRRHQMM